MASVDKSLDAANIDDNAAADATSSCLNDPNYAIICVFLQKFGGHLKIEHPDFLRLQKMIENTDEVPDELRQFFVKLLRKTRKSVQPDKLDSALAKFCYTYSAQDAWEIERFGYKKSSLQVKLRVLKEVLESQFDKNPNFRTLVSAQTAAELRSQPLGKDKLGNAYWSTVDDQCNLRIYQEHLDEEIWKVVATNRDEMAKLIACLRGNELVMPSLVGIIDEDSSSNSMPPKVDALQTENGASNGTTNGNDSDEKNVPCLKIKLNSNGAESTVEQISNADNTNGAKNDSIGDEEEEEDASIMSEIDELSQAASESSATTAGTKSTETQGSKRISLMASKPPSNANKLKLRIFATDKKTMKRNMEEDSDTPSGKSKRPSMQDKSNDDDDSEFESEEMSDEELDDISGDEDDEVGPAIEEPTMYVQGEGSGAANNCENTLWPDCDDESDESDVGEAIEESVIYVFGQGNGFDCDVGNNDIKTTESAESSTEAPPPLPPQPVVQSKPMFFFGQAGCLKLSPMKPAVTSDNSSATNKNDTDTDSEKSQEENTMSPIANEINTNDTNSVALDAKSESIPENNTTDETDKGISAVIESPALTNLPENNIGDKIETTLSSNDQSTTQIVETDELKINAKQSEMTTSVAAIVDDKSESSKENIESNSSVALANISVQEEEVEGEKSVSIEKESLPTTSETVLQAESHLLNDTIEQNEISVSVEKQSTELEVANDDLKSIEKENEPEPEQKLNEMCSEIDVNESNDMENENQSSVSPDAEEPSLEEAKAEPVTRKDVPIENQTISSKNDETIESTSEQVQETKAIPIKNDVELLTEENEQKELTEPGDSDKSSELNIESNNDSKTESLSEQNIIESNAAESNLQETSTSEPEIPTAEPEIVPPVEIPIEKSIENASELYNQVENRSTDDSDEIPSEQFGTDISTESAVLPDEQNKILPSTCEEIEQTPSESAADIVEQPTSIEVAPVHVEASEPSLLSKTVVCKSIPNSKTEPELIAQIENEPMIYEQTESNANTCPPETVENNETGFKETVSLEAESVASVSVHITEPEYQETTHAHSERLETSHEIVKKSETIANEILIAPIIEKRKSIDQIEEVSECKKICEEKILEQPIESTNVQINAVIEEKVNEIPTTSQVEFVPAPSEIVQQNDSVEVAEAKTAELKTIKQQDEIESLTLSEEPETIVQEEKQVEQISSGITICNEASKSEKSDLNEISISKTEDFVANAIPSVAIHSVVKGSEFIPEEHINKSKNVEPEIQKPLENVVKASIEAPVAIAKKEKSPSPAPAATRAQAIHAQSSRVAQLRTRKRRISSEKARHSSESDDNNDALIESPVSQDASSDEEVGGKRIKMRPRAGVKRSVRKSVEQKRNIKDTDWSSDDNEKPNAKRATSEISKNAEKILPSPAKVELEPDRKKTVVKEEILATKKTEEAPAEETKVKHEEEPTEQQSEEEQATPARRPGRPARRGRKPGPKPKAKPVEEIKTECVKDEPVEKNESIKEEKTESTPTVTPSKPETRRKKRSIMGLDIAEIETAQAAVDADTPVRQSRRIAQIKIREEAERRKAEEVALLKMKEASEKKKKGVSVKESASEEEDEEEEEENSESEAKLEKKKKRKKGINKDKPWQTNSDDSSEREEEDVYEHEDVERLPPLGSDHEFSPESDIEDESQIVPTKRARTARKDKTERREEESEEEEDIHACQKCSKSDHPEWILLCDKCDKGYHCSCLIPVLFVIPEGDWFCPPCQQEKLIDHLEIKLLEFDNMVERKEIEEAQRQRLLITTISEANVIKDTKRDRQRARALDSSESSSTEEESDAEEKIGKSSERRTRPRPRPNRQRNRSESESEASSSDNTSDNEPIYKLRKRRQANVSYRFNEYDELINRAIKSEMDEVAGAGNLGRGKDISTIIEADKEEKRLKKLEEQQKERDVTVGEVKEKDDDDSDDQPLKIKADNSDGSDSEPIRPKAIKRSKNVGGRKKKKLNSLDVDSDEDADSSDDDFNTSSYSDEEEEDSSPASESSLDSIVKKKRGKGRSRISTRRSVRDRKKRYDNDFIDDSSFDDEDNIPLVKKKKKVESDFDDFDDSSEEQEEDVDSEDLCEDSTDDSDRSWGKKKKKASNKAVSNKNRKKKPEGERSFKGKTAKKKIKVSGDDDDDDDDDESGSDEENDEILPKSRRTRGKKLPYLLDDDFDSSDDGIKPGVKRPDTPPEERAAFIKKQEEIKRMLAEKENDDKSLHVPPPQKDSLSTIPLQIIQTAKALDVDLKKSAILHRNASDNDSNGFDDDLPEDFDPEDMDEDAIAKMMEEEEFAQHQLKLAGETIRNRKLKDALTIDPMKKDDSPTKLTIETGSSVIMQTTIPSLVSPLPLSTSQLTIPDIPPSMYTAQFQGANNKQSTTPKKRGRKTKDDISSIGPKEQVLSQMPTIQHTSVLPPQPNKPNTPLNMPSVLQHAPISQLFASPTIQHTSSVIAHSSVIQQQQQQQRLPPMTQTVASSILGMAQNREPIIPSTVLDVQNTRLLDPSELGKPPDDLLDPAAKKRARSRKKITPTRDSLITSPPNVTVSPGITQPSPVISSIPNVPNVSKPITSILSERLSANPVDKSGLSIATPPQLYSPSSRSQASVITRLTRPSQRQPFPSGQSPPQRYYAPNASMPPSHSIPSTATGTHARPYHTPNVTVASGPRPPPLVPPPPHTSGHLPHPMYMRGQPGIYGGYPNIQPPPMHRSLQSIEHATNSPQNFTGAYQNLPFGSYYAAAQAAAAERRSGAIISTFEPFDNKNPASHDRLPAYAHPSLGLAALAGRNPTTSGDVDDDRTGPPAPQSIIGPGGSTSEFSGLVSYFSSQQDDLDS